MDLYVPLGKAVALPPDVWAGLEQALRQPAGFASDEAIRPWLKPHDHRAVTSHPLYTLIRPRFNATLQGPRPRHPKTP